MTIVQNVRQQKNGKILPFLSLSPVVDFQYISADFMQIRTAFHDMAAPVFHDLYNANSRHLTQTTGIS
jgi:hypothetical protein